MTQNELIEKLKVDYIGDKEAIILSSMQSMAKSRHEYDPETYVFCEIITAIGNRRNIIRISGSRFKNDQIPKYINIQAMHIMFRSSGHPNIPSYVHDFKNVFEGYMTNDGKDSEFSYSLLLALLKNINSFFTGPFKA